MLCPCGSSKNYEICCKPFHDAFIDAPTAEALMRSRYSAFVLKLRGYLLRTWDEESRPKFLSFEKDLLWLSLEILETEQGLESDTEGFVEFKAYYRKGSSNKRIKPEVPQEYPKGFPKGRKCLHERSYFKKIADKWIYVNGVLLG